MHSANGDAPPVRSARTKRGGAGRDARERHHEALVETLASRFYMNEQAILVRNGLSTDLLCFPSDKLAGHKHHLKTKILHAMEYATAFTDVMGINALKRVAYHAKDDSVAPDDYLVLGLYLYLEDECSRLGRNRTFLTALREVGARLRPDEEYAPYDLLQRVKGALHSLQMDEYAPILAGSRTALTPSRANCIRAARLKKIWWEPIRSLRRKYPCITRIILD